MDFLERVFKHVKGTAGAASSQPDLPSSSRDPARHPIRSAPASLCKRSQAWQQITSSWGEDDALSVLDLGCTSSANFRFLIDRGFNLHHVNLLHAVDQSLGPAGEPPHVSAFLHENLRLPVASLDLILLWDLLDYLPEDLIRPIVDRLSVSMRPGGMLLAFFHSRDAGLAPPLYDFHIRDHETIEWRPRDSRPVQQFFHVRHVENLFSTFRTIRFFLGPEGAREVMMLK